MILSITNAIPEVTLIVEKNLAITLKTEGREEMWHAESPQAAFASYGFQQPMFDGKFSNAVGTYKGSLHQKFRDLDGFFFEFNGIKLAESKTYQIFLTWAGSLLIVKRSALTLNVEEDPRGNHDVTSSTALYTYDRFDCKSLRGEDDVRTAVSKIVKSEERAEIYTQLGFSTTYYLE